MVQTAASLPHPRELRAALNVPREFMARLMGVSAKTIERWEARPEPPAAGLVKLRLSQLQAIAELGRMVYTSEGLPRFLSMPLPCFGGHTAAQLIEVGQSDRVLAALAADYEGIGV